MIPSLVVSDIRSSLVEYLSSTFALSDDDVRDELSQFLTDPAEGIFRGPYLRVRTPFRAVDESWRPPLDWIPDGFVPYQHQADAFDRLATGNGHIAQPTLVTTGTGSGKTECFLYPILDHCARERAAGKPGIKALILYPMNALASDQAGRLAELLYNERRLGGVTAGIYVGGEGGKTTMGPDHLIEKREALRADPPDILLTNYKMLDFLLLRREDRDLWATNGPDTLRYVVLDEFHTYDGAQGTDVAMLLRRLGRTLGMATPERPLGSAVPAATSATLGSGAGAATNLREFATKVFGAEFDEDSVIGETRQTVDDACLDIDFDLPVPDPGEFGDDDTLELVAAAFCRRLPDPEKPDASIDPLDPTDVVELGDRLLAHPLTRAVLSAVDERARPWPEAVAEINKRVLDWGRAYQRNAAGVERALGRFLWLLSLARRRQGDRLRPLFSVEVQLWVREVSRLLRTVDTAPGFRWLDSAAIDADAPDQIASTDELDPDAAFPVDELVTAELPAVYCRRCGMAGWMAVQSELGDTLLANPNTIYAAAIMRQPTVRALIRASADDPNARWYDRSAHRLEGEAGPERVPVLVTAGEDDAKNQRCPACNARDAIRFLGLQVASLASVSVNTLFGSPHLDEDERKLLAFTDSVQDASHRAGFFAGRTNRINLRTLMAGVVEDTGRVSLADLGDQLLAEADTARARFGLVPPDLVRHPRIRTVWTDKVDETGTELLRQRLGFEVDIEFGLRSRVGRTLELARAAVAQVEVDELDAVTDLVAEDLRRLTQEVDADTLVAIEPWLRGLVERLRLRGGIVHPLLDPYIKDNGRQWFVWGGRPDGLPPFTPGQGRPTFYTTSPKGDLDSLAALHTTPTWVVDWGVRNLGLEPRLARDLTQNAVKLLAAETEAVIATPASGGATVYGLDRRHVFVHDIADDDDQRSVAGVRCAMCGNRHPVPIDQVDSWRNTLCLRYRCTGRYEPDVPTGAEYYRSLYRSRVTRRVVTAEHTGLLEREAREELERAFKSGTAPDAPNVITATPTLEMGIDIGDLSAVMLTSVPRNPASYIQRVGRAGRLTGNSLIATFVRTDTHGLYYLSDPEAMIAGEVRPPNCYLDAVETLERQYIAYLVDRVADLTIEADPLPHAIGPLMNKGLDQGSTLHALVQASTLDTTHIDGFLALFGTQLQPETVERLRAFASNEIAVRLKTAVETWTTQQHELSLRQKRLINAIDKLEQAGHLTPSQEEELSNLKGQRRAIIRLIEKNRGEYVLTALERLSVLPNYTLTDDGTTLEATTWGRDNDGDYEVTQIEYKRTARLALREFAPGNSFYAGGHRHIIDALEIGSADEPLFESWRLCPDCGYGTIESEGEIPKFCPRCGATTLADVGSRHRLLRLSTAYASGSEESARVYDESDERRREAYEIITTVDAEPAHVSSGWVLADRAFGAELSGRTHVRSLNLGMSHKRGESVPIAGANRHLARFDTCRQCGAVREARDDQNGARPERLHQGWCKVRSGAAKEQWEQLVLLHQLTTEAVRLLLPVSMFEVDERMASFKGALLLGLREDFGGDPDHLDVIRSDMPNHHGQGRRQYLVLYDRVPGGTGYLARLADPDRIRRILDLARRTISRCPCRAEGRPACHRCLLGVVDRNEYELARRDLALEILDDLLDNWEPEPVDTIDRIDIAKVEESELERRFKVAIRDWASRPEIPVTWKPVPGHNGHDAFELSIDFDRQAIRYRIDEQQGLSTTPSSIPDFIIRRQDTKAPDIAVYLDGFQFHASAENNNLDADAAKRAAARANGMLVWNLTWDDVQSFHKAASSEVWRNPPDRPLLSGPGRQVALSAHKQQNGALDFDVVNFNPMALLLDYLTRPDLVQWERLTLSALAGAISTSAGPTPVDAAAVPDLLAAGLAGSIAWPSPASDPVAVGGTWISPRDHRLQLFLETADPSDERWTVISSIPDSPTAIGSNEHPGRWHDWLQWANLLQFLRGSGREAVIAANSTDPAVLDIVWLMAKASPPPDQAEPEPATPAVAVITELNQDQEDELDLLEPAVEELVRSALFAGAPDFIAGHELDGDPIEAAWPDRKVGVLREDQDMTAAGWTLRSVDQWTVESLVATLGGER